MVPNAARALKINETDSFGEKMQWKRRFSGSTTLFCGSFAGEVWPGRSLAPPKARADTRSRQMDPPSPARAHGFAPQRRPTGKIGLPNPAQARGLSMLLFKSRPPGETEKKKGSLFLSRRNTRFRKANCPSYSACHRPRLRPKIAPSGRRAGTPAVALRPSAGKVDCPRAAGGMKRTLLPAVN
jgi:hypothetical protein